ncbi:quinon protein alcohol dehydrogenase-like superfamily, partial [Suillus spraguei]
VNRIAVSPDGLMVVGECGNGRLRLWNIKEESLVGHPWEGNSDGLVCLDWSPNGAEVAGGSKDGTIRRWNSTTGRQIAPPIKTSNEFVMTIKYSPQGDKFASGCEDKIRVWSKNGKLLIEIKARDSWVMSILCWSKDGAYIFASLQDHTIRKWQSIDGEELVAFQGHTANICSLCLSPDGCHLVTASFDYSVRLVWTYIPLWWTVIAMIQTHLRVVNTIAVSPDGLMVVSECRDDRLRLWNIKEESLVGHPWEENSDGVTCLDWSPNGAEVAGGSKRGTIRRWNPATGRQMAPSIKRGNEFVTTIKYSPQGDKFASGCEDKIRVWSKNGELLMEIKGHADEDWVISLCWSKDGAHIFASLTDHTIRKWQSIDGEELFVFHGHTSQIYSLCLSPNGCHLLSASYDHSVRIWDLETNQQVGDPLWHDNNVLAVAMSSDGQYFASAISGQDGKIYVWNLE